MLRKPLRNVLMTTEKGVLVRKFIVIIGLLAIVASAAAIAGTGKQEEVANKIKAELKKIDARVKLTPDQKTQIKTLLGEQATKVDAIYAEIEPEVTAVREEYRGKIRGVLTPEQQTEWDKIKGEYKDAWTGKGKP
jgi:hypothetical protein